MNTGLHIRHRTRPRPDRCAGGLTLIELMIGLAVLAILGAMALPQIGARLAQQRLSLAAETLAADVAEARFEAARRSRVAVVSAQAGAAWCWAVDLTGTPAAASPTSSASAISPAAPPCPCKADSGCATRQVMASAHPGVRMVHGLTVRLESSGRAEPTRLAVFESSRGQRLRVEVLAMGRARICSEGGALGRYPGC